MWVSLVRRNLQEGMGDYSTMPLPPPVLTTHSTHENGADCGSYGLYLEQSTHKKKPGDGSKLLRRYNLWPKPVKSPSPSPTTSPTEFELKSLLLLLCVLWKSIKSSCLRRSAKALEVPLWVSGRAGVAGVIALHANCSGLSQKKNNNRRRRRWRRWRRRRHTHDTIRGEAKWHVCLW